MTNPTHVRGTIKPLPPQAHLNEILKYDSETGKLFWRHISDEITSDHVERASGWSAQSRNSRLAGKEALTYSDRRGYKHGMIGGKSYQAHRIIWKMFYGEDPEIIDHINGRQGDNRISNLRSCTNAENSRNYKKITQSTSKYRGVSWVKRDQKWAARISDGNGMKISLGNHSCEIQAAMAYDAMARKVHGEFATLNFPEDS